MTRTLRTGDLVRVAKQARYEGSTYGHPEVGTEGKIVQFLNVGSGKVYPVFRVLGGVVGDEILIDIDCLELIEPVTEEEVQKAIDSIQRVTRVPRRTHDREEEGT